MLSEIKHLRKINMSITNPRARPVRHWKSPTQGVTVGIQKTSQSVLTVRASAHSLPSRSWASTPVWFATPVKEEGKLTHATFWKTLKLSNVCMTLCTHRKALLGNSYLTFEANRVKPLTCRNQWQICNCSPDRHVFFLRVRVIWRIQMIKSLESDHISHV